MKNTLVLAAMLAIAPVLAGAESKPAPKKSPTAVSRPAAKAPAKSSGKTQAKVKAKSHRKAVAKQTEPTDRDKLRSAAAQFAAGVRAADRALTPDELALADRVQTGRIPCELGNVVMLTSDPKAPGHFDLQLQNARYRMSPVETSTGAVRLEDQRSGAVWLQLANKSMLMNQKLGQRLADDCQSPAQLQVADSLKRTPGPTLFDSEPAMAEAPGASAPPSAAAATARRSVAMPSSARRSAQRQ